MNKRDFIKHLAKTYRRSQRHYDTAITEIFEGLQEKLAAGKEVSFLGFGTFYTRQHKGGKGLNFKTKQPVEYKALRQAAFRPGSLLKQAVRRKKGLFR
ncbi:transcriptional regulator [Dictyobacter formicarum]|uniref:Transcriptional regulator n=2 Tax=Dictyobacter formicarum TaxID=2778368 RepID=A0ABQ3VHR4_9CHLR|nr:transcriptional regulator [Dictyobacter formicarum]